MTSTQFFCLAALVMFAPTMPEKAAKISYAIFGIAAVVSAVMGL